jgi:NhaP-type Na+/H+ or K+/H+ antiporter
MYADVALLAAFVFVYSAVAGALERTWFSGPVVFTIFGLLIGPFGLDLLSFHAERGTLKTLAELALALILFTDAADADVRILRRTSRLPLRLLLIGLPLTILLGFGVGVALVGQLSLLELAIVATMLAPTDAALGQAVVANEAVPDDVRQALNVESGLNDGICVPILFVFLALAAGEASDQETWQLALTLVAEEIGIGLSVGLVLTALGIFILNVAGHRDWQSDIWIQVPVIALALACFACAEWLGGSGFIAAFCGGLLFGVLEKGHRQRLLRAGEGSGRVLALITWVIFGSAVVGQAAPYFSWLSLVYAALSLTVIRMLSVFLALSGTGVNTEGKLFMGWFGPRGLASVVFAVIVLDADLPHSGMIAMIVVCTITLSIVAHGLSSEPWSRAFGARTGSDASGSGK